MPLSPGPDDAATFRALRPFVEAHRQDPLYPGVKTLIRALAAERQRSQALEHRVAYDDVTGLPNMLAFDLELGVSLERESRRLQRYPNDEPRLVVGFLDLDRFKEVNDTLPGRHDAGDEWLCAVAEGARVLRGHDLLARRSGDEFLFLSTQAGLDGAVAGLTRVVDATFDAAVRRVQDRPELFLTALPSPEQLPSTAMDLTARMFGLSYGFVPVTRGHLADFRQAPDNVKTQLLHEADVQMYAQKQARKHAVAEAAADSESIPLATILRTRHLLGYTLWNARPSWLQSAFGADCLQRPATPDEAERAALLCVLRVEVGEARPDVVLSDDVMSHHPQLAAASKLDVAGLESLVRSVDLPRSITPLPTREQLVLDRALRLLPSQDVTVDPSGPSEQLGLPSLTRRPASELTL
jgi:diguanylate cyclase (GGDEF)-like protein